METSTKIKSEILIGFRPLSRKDLPFKMRWWRNYKVREFLPDLKRNNSEQEKKWFDTYLKDKSKIYFMIICNRKPVGVVSLYGIDRINKHAEIFIVIGEDAYRNKGVGKAAVKFAANYGFDKLNLHKIKISANVKNITAVRSYLGAGFNKEAVLRDEFLRKGKFEDEILMYKLNSGLK